MFSNLRCRGIRNCKSNPHHKLAESTYICWIRLHLWTPEHLRLFACCGTRNKTNVPITITLQVSVRGIHKNFVSFDSKFRNTQTQNSAQTSAQFGLVMLLNVFLARTRAIGNFDSKLKSNITRLLVSGRSPEGSDCLLRFYGAVITLKNYM